MYIACYPFRSLTKNSVCDLFQIRIRQGLKLKGRIRIWINAISWIRIRIHISLQMTSQNVWQMSLFKHFFKVEPFWKLGSRSASKWKERSGSAWKWQAGSGSGSASKWRAGSGSGSAWKWRAGSGSASRWCGSTELACLNLEEFYGGPYSQHCR